MYTSRTLIVASVVVGLIAYDAWRYRRAIRKFAEFTNLWNRPAVDTNDRTYREAMANADHV